MWVVEITKAVDAGRHQTSIPDPYYVSRIPASALRSMNFLGGHLHPGFETDMIRVDHPHTSYVDQEI